MFHELPAMNEKESPEMLKTPEIVTSPVGNNIRVCRKYGIVV